jgi:hypothetical protein
VKLTEENRSTRGKTCPRATMSTTNPTWTDPGSNPGLRGERPATNRLSHGTALYISYRLAQSALCLSRGTQQCYKWLHVCIINTMARRSRNTHWLRVGQCVFLNVFARLWTPSRFLQFCTTGYTHCYFNPLKTKRILSSIKTQGVPHSKHSPPQLKKKSFDDV